MPSARLSALDASFLAAETPAAHMHVGWVAVFDPPDDRPPPGFGELRDHIAARLARAPRCRQRLAAVPFGVHYPLWVDDEAFDIDHHVLRARVADLGSLVDLAMCSQLERTRPVWELWVAERLSDGRVGVVGKAHHCMVDGLATVELGSLLLDPERDPMPPAEDEWQPEPPSGRASLLARGLLARVRDEIDVLRLPARVLVSPRRSLGELAGEGRGAALALGHSLAAPAPMSPFNAPSSPLRGLGMVGRPLDDLRRIRARYGTTINDVVLAVCAGGVRRFLQQHGERPIRLKAMVPVNVRETDAASALGNRISFMFVDLPCDEPDPVRRLLAINRVTTARKLMGEPEGADTVLKVAAYSPHWVQHAMTRLVASPRTFNLVVSNIPGPRQPLYLRGCRLAEAYPIVPLAQRHAVSIGVTTIADRMYFGLYADRKALPDVDLLARDVDEAIDELLGLDPTGGRHPPASLSDRFLSGAPA